MEKNIFLLLLLLLVQCTIAQTDSTTVKTGEFKIYGNGLIYSEATMSHIRTLVDSLNLRFKACEPKTFHSLEQGNGSFISITKNVKRAREAILRDITLDQFIRKFPRNKVHKNNLIAREEWFYRGEKRVTYSCRGDDYHWLYSDVEIKSTKGGWIFQDYGDAIDAIHVSELKSYVIPNEYARLIQYVDCIVDTTASMFPENRISDSVAFALAPDSKVKAFLTIAMDFEGKPSELSMEGWQNEELRLKYEKDYKKWNLHRMAALDEKMHNASTFKIFNEAIDEAITKQNGLYLEGYAERYLPAKRILELRRSYVVHGACSADTRPREHAQRICELAAEARQWDIFLGAHLDILNDNFSRSSDGSYAWQSRGTYIRELEEAGINANELLIGTTLSAKGLNKNHYASNSHRTGRSLAESKNREAAEKLLLQMAQDERLDLYNRIELIFVLIFCNRNLDSKLLYGANLAKIKVAVSSLPKSQQALYAELLKY